MIDLWQKLLILKQIKPFILYMQMGQIISVDIFLNMFR
jgi:hypothetical protein